MVAMATSTVRKDCTCLKSIIWMPDYHLIMPWKEYKNFIFSQNLEGIFGVIHQCIRDGIPYKLSHWANTGKRYEVCTFKSYTYLALFYAPDVMWCLFLESMQDFVIHILYDLPYHLSCAWEWNTLFYVNRDIKLVETRDRYHVPSYAMSCVRVNGPAPKIDPRDVNNVSIT